MDPGYTQAQGSHDEETGQAASDLHTPYDQPLSPENSHPSMYLPNYDSLVQEVSAQNISGRRSSVVSKMTHEKLLRWSTRVIAFLNNLTQDPSGQMGQSGQPRKVAMPISAFAKPKALAFVFRKSYGIGIGGVLNEVGFITRKLVHPDGHISWSPPYFLTGRGYSVGLSIGRLTTGYCLALLNEEAVQRCLTRKVKFGAQFRFFVDMDGAYVRPVRIDSTNETDNVIDDGQGGLIAKYFRLEAMMVDLTFNWARNIPFRKLNEAVYGPDVAQDEVLGGTVPGPPEFDGVLDLLSRLSAAGDTKSARKIRGRNAQLSHDRSTGGRERSMQFTPSDT